MNDHHASTRFTRNNRFLHALTLESQAWFSVRDLGRMMGHHLDERLTRKLDTDQYRFLPLDYHGKVQPTLMVSESGAYALMIHHYIPENTHLRQWLTHEVIPELRSAASAMDDQGPSVSSLQWAGCSVSLMHWRNDAWVKWRDMPVLMPVVESAPEPGLS